MRDRPKTKSQRKAARLDAEARAAAVTNGAATLGLGQSADRLDQATSRHFIGGSTIL